MLNDYLNNNDKRMSRDLPRERVENKIKRFKEFINVPLLLIFLFREKILLG